MIKCSILPDCNDCSSDHLPVMCSFCLTLHNETLSNHANDSIHNMKMVPKYAATKWQHDSFISSYKENVVIFSSNLSLPYNVSDIVAKQDA